MLCSELGIGKYVLVKHQQRVKELSHSPLELFVQSSVMQRNLDLILLHAEDSGLTQPNTLRYLLNFKYAEVPLNSEGLLRVQDKHRTDSSVTCLAPSHTPHYCREEPGARRRDLPRPAAGSPAPLCDASLLT